MAAWCFGWWGWEGQSGDVVVERSSCVEYVVGWRCVNGTVDERSYIQMFVGLHKCLNTVCEICLLLRCFS